MYDIRYTTKFEKDYELCQKRNYNMTELIEVMLKIQNREKLEVRYQNHFLSGNWKGHEECHVKPNWLLIYKIDDEKEIIVFARTGSHSDLFH